MNPGSIPLNLLILLFSILGALFSFLIWRTSESRGLYSQKEIIREEHQRNGDEIPISFLVGSSHLTLLVSVNHIECYEPEPSLLYRLKRPVFGSNGNTVVQLSLEWDKVPEKLPELGAMNLERAIDRLDDKEEFDGRIAPSGYGKQSIEIFSTRPKKVHIELNTFFNLVKKAVETEIKRYESTSGNS